MRLDLWRAGWARLLRGRRVTLEKVALVIADISGYTRFTRLSRGTQIHAEEIIFQLIEAVVDKAEYPLSVNKLEGDAVFLYSKIEGREAEAAPDIAAQVVAFSATFRAKAEELSRNRATCPCDACQHVLDLRLKAVMHYGIVTFKKIRRFEELAGEDVILVHRLLKNGIEASEYILMTDAFHRHAGDIPGYERRTTVENNEHFGSIGLVVYTPGVARDAQAVAGPAAAIATKA